MELMTFALCKYPQIPLSFTKQIAQLFNNAPMSPHFATFLQAFAENIPADFESMGFTFDPMGYYPSLAGVVGCSLSGQHINLDFSHPEYALTLIEKGVVCKVPPQLLQSEFPNVRMQAVRYIDDPFILVSAATKEKDSHIRIALLDKLSQLTTKCDIIQLQPLLVDPIVKVRHAAYKVLKQFEPIQMMPIARLRLIDAIRLCRLQVSNSAMLLASSIFPILFEIDIFWTLYFQQFYTEIAIPHFKSRTHISKETTIIDDQCTTDVTCNYVKTISVTSTKLKIGQIKEILCILTEFLSGGFKRERIVIIKLIKKFARQGHIALVRNTPDLYPTLISIGSMNVSHKVYVQILKVLGRIGPMPPPPRNDEEDSIDLSKSLYFKVVTDVALAVIDDESRSNLFAPAHAVIIESFLYPPKDEWVSGFFERYIENFLTSFTKTTKRQQNVYFDIMLKMSVLPVERMIPYGMRFFEIFEHCWDSNYTDKILELIPHFSKYLIPKKNDISFFVSKLLDLLTNDSAVIALLALIGDVDSSYASIALDSILLFEPTHVKLQAIRALVQIQNPMIYIPRIIDSVLSNSGNGDLEPDFVHIIIALVTATPQEMLAYKDTLLDVFASNHYVCRVFRQPLSDFHSMVPTTYNFSKPVEEVSCESFNASQFVAKIKIGIDLKAWIWNLMETCITYSPHRVIAITAPLTASKRASKSLFNLAFLSIWQKLPQVYQNEVISIFRDVLNDYNTPTLVFVNLMDMIDFVIHQNTTPILTNEEMMVFAQRAEMPALILRYATTPEQLAKAYQLLGMDAELEILARETPSVLSSPSTDSFDFNERSDKHASERAYVKRAESMLQIHDQWHSNRLDCAQNLPRTMPTVFTEINTELKKKGDVTKLCREGFSYLATAASSHFSKGFKAIAPFIIHAERLIEMKEIQRNDPEATYKCMTRLQDSLSVFKYVRPLLENRLEIANDPEIATFLLKLARKAGAWSVIETHDHMSLEYIHLLWVRGDAEIALDHLDKLGATPKVRYMKAMIMSQSNTQNNTALYRQIKTLCEGIDTYKATNLYAWVSKKLIRITHNASTAALAFIQAIQLDNKSRVADAVQLVKVVSKYKMYPHQQDVENALDEIDIARFKTVVPQLMIVRDPPPHAKPIIAKLINRLFDAYPDSVVFSIITCLSAPEKSSFYEDIYNNLKASNPTLVSAAEELAKGLTNAAMSLGDHLLALTIEAYHIFCRHDDVSDRKIKALAKDLELFKKHLEREDIEYDTNFYSTNKKLIDDALSLIDQFVTNFANDPNPQIDFRGLRDKAINANMRKHYSLRQFAPMVSSKRSWPIMIPGCADVKLFQVCNTLKVITSKMRPRQINMVSDTGAIFTFLLKGCEDLRTDERVMQYYNLVNSILGPDLPRIVMLKVTPLSCNSGIISWVKNSVNMAQMIIDYRSKIAKIQRTSNILEAQIIEETSEKPAQLLMSIQRLEALVDCDAQTQNRVNDLHEMMWYSSPSSEQWQTATQEFIRSTALNSIAGYVIGLGDRHPDNIMIERTLGRIVMIDFGDALERSEKRRHFPEQVPFRLTRMMVAAMGQHGLEGPFQYSCESVMRAIRENSTSISAALAIFKDGPVTHDTRVNPPVRTPSQTERIKIKINDVMKSIHRKVRGFDEDMKIMSVKDQVTRLISAARNMYHLAGIYPGWQPLL